MLRTLCYVMLCYVINDLVFTILEICEDEAYLQHH